MRQVIRRFLKHLEAEKNASATTIESYQYDLHKFDAYLVKRLGNKFLPGDVSRMHVGQKYGPFIALQAPVAQLTS